MLKRRAFLQGLAGLAAVTVSDRPIRARAPRVRIGIVGGGILGASIALHLAQAGAHVTLNDDELRAHGALAATC
jgi:NADPH-dependent 2,4-dienoyl-CoA reductase/sulfur reductase-like enzyme